MGNAARVREFISSPRLASWTRILTRFLSLEALVQGLGFAAGILLVRVLPKAEYGLFTIGNTMQQTMNLLADNGISSGLTAIGGRVWNDRLRFGQLLHTAMRLRRTLAVIAVAAVTPILVWMLLNDGATPGYTALITGTVLLGLYFQLTIGVLIVAPRLHLEVTKIQMLSVGAAAVRLVLIASAYGIYLNSAVALLAGAISFGFQEFVLRRWISQFAEAHAPMHAGDRREILTIVKAQAPNSIYYCIQSQLTIWLVSIFGSGTAVADVGALGRLSSVFVVIGSVMGNVICPRFARIHEPVLLWRRYWQILGGFCVLALCILAFAGFFPQVLLWILGPKYAHLEKELFLMILSAVLLSILGNMWHLNVTKGWIVSPWALIPTGVAMQIILVLVLDLSQVRDVLLLNIYSIIPAFFLNFWRTRQGIRDAAQPPCATDSRVSL